MESSLFYLTMLIANSEGLSRAFQVPSLSLRSLAAFSSTESSPVFESMPGFSRTIRPHSRPTLHKMATSSNRPNNPYSDFDDDYNFINDDNGQCLAKQFYQEVEQRRNRMSEFDCEVDVHEEGNIRRDVSDDAAGLRRNKIEVQRQLTSRTTPNPTKNLLDQTPNSSQFLFGINFPIALPSISPAMASSPSAGLFSGGGPTVRSTGRMAPIPVDTNTMTLSVDNTFDDGVTPEIMAKVALGFAFLLWGLYLAAQLSGNMETLEGIAEDVTHIVMDSVLDGIGSVMNSVSGVVGESMDRLLLEEASLASFVETLARPVESITAL